MILLDNTKPHKVSKVKNFLENLDITGVLHPPYSPDLSPCDYWLFPLIKRELGYKRYSSREEINHSIKEIIERIPKENFKNSFEEWINRMKYIINNNGEYYINK